VESYPQHKLFYVDECGLDKYIHREYGYAPVGERVHGKVSGKKYKRTNIIAAKCGDKIAAPMIYDGTTDSVLFEHWFECALLREIPKYSVIVLDNAAFHRKSKLHELAKQANCEVLFLPPYSPDLNPIEKFWAWLKSKIRKLISFYDNFDDALIDCFKFAQLYLR